MGRGEADNHFTFPFPNHRLQLYFGGQTLAQEQIEVQYNDYKTFTSLKKFYCSLEYFCTYNVQVLSLN